MGGVGPIVGVVTFALMHLEFGAAVGGSGSLWFETVGFVLFVNLACRCRGTSSVTGAVVLWGARQLRSD